MKRLALGLLILVGCPEKEAPPEEKPKRERPVDRNLPMNVAKPDRARVELDLAAVRSAVRAHQQLNGGQSPKSLDALGLNLSFEKDLTYDPATGTVKSKTYPEL